VTFETSMSVVRKEFVIYRTTPDNGDGLDLPFLVHQHKRKYVVEGLSKTGRVLKKSRKLKRSTPSFL
jgi:hypothetical protein